MTDKYTNQIKEIYSLGEQKREPLSIPKYVIVNGVVERIKNGSIQGLTKLVKDCE